MSKEEIDEIVHKLTRIRTLTGKQALSIIKPLLDHVKQDIKEVNLNIKPDNNLAKVGDWFLFEPIYSEFIEAWKLFKGHRLSPVQGFRELLLHNDYESVVPLLKNAIEKEARYKNLKKEKGEWVEDWTHFKTWVQQRRWEQELPDIAEVKESVL